MKILLISLIAVFGSMGPATAELDNDRFKRAVIKTSAICGMCKTTIEAAVNDLAGIQNANLDIASRKLRVRYNARVVSLDEIKMAVVGAGYSADDIPANRVAYDALPGCCQKEGACGMPEGEGGR